jgi:TolB-like protein
MVLYVQLQGKALYQFVLPQHGVDTTFSMPPDHCQSSDSMRVGRQLSVTYVLRGQMSIT